MRTETEVRKERIHYITDFEDAKRGHEPRNAGGSLEAGKGKKTDSPSLWKEHRSPDILIFIPVKFILNF